MGSTRERITCAVRTLSSITSQIFRCHGLDASPSRGDRLGLHDVAWWMLFIAALCAWFLWLFAPQRERLNNLTEREHVLRGHMQAEKRELARLRRSIAELTRDNPFAWERAARGRLGWVEQGEITDVVAWSHNHALRVPAPSPGAAPPPQPLTPIGPLPRPRIPALPAAPPAQGNPKLAVASDSIDPAALGLVRGTPPPLPLPPPSSSPSPSPRVANLQPHPRLVPAALPNRLQTR